MIELGALLVPVLVSAVAVFFVSFVMWMVLPHHKTDWGPLPDEDSLMDSIRSQSAGAGQYVFPHTPREKMRDPDFQKKCADGPSGVLIVRPTGPVNIGKSMLTSTAYNLGVSLFCAYIASFTLPKAADSMHVFRLVGSVAFLSYAGALVWGPIWFSRSWSSTLKEMFDGLVYGCVTGLLFVVMWPS